MDGSHWFTMQMVVERQRALGSDRGVRGELATGTIPEFYREEIPTSSYSGGSGPQV